MIILRALACAILLAFVGAFVGPVIALALMSAPPGACGMFAIVPIGYGAVFGIAGGALLGLLWGLLM